MQLKNELHHLSLKTNTITQYLSQVQTLVDHIASAGCKIDNEDIILYVLNGLTPPYQPFKAAIRTRAGPLTLDELYSLLITEEIVLAEETNQELQASHTALYSARGRGCWTVRGRGSRPPSSYRIDSSSSSPPVCQICSKVGHKASDCWHRTNLNIAPPTKPPRLQAFLASSLASNPEWVLDTGASSHLTPNYSQLTQPEPYQGSSSVQIGNGSSLPIAHSGNGILPTLTNNLRLTPLYHVPSLSHHLLSVQSLASTNNCTLTFDANGFQIQDRHSHKVLLKDPCTNGLYVDLTFQ